MSAWDRPPPVSPKFRREAINAPNDAADLGKQRVPEETWFQDINPYEFERRLLEIFLVDGLSIKETPKARDGGLDGIVYSPRKQYGLQVKRQKSPVSGQTLQRFIGALTTSKLRSGIFITTSRFTESAQRYAVSQDICLVDGKLLRPIWTTKHGLGSLVEAYEAYKSRSQRLRTLKTRNLD